MQLRFASLSLSTIQFAAILGDLSHKQDIYLQLQSFSPNVTCLFANCEQASWLLINAPQLIPSGQYNNHSLGTFFEYYYYSNLTFRFQFLATLPTLICVC